MLGSTWLNNTSLIREAFTELIRLIIVLSRYFLLILTSRMVYVRKIFRDLCHFQNFGCIIFPGLVREVVGARGACIPCGCSRQSSYMPSSCGATGRCTLKAHHCRRSSAVKQTRNFGLKAVCAGPGGEASNYRPTHASPYTNYYLLSDTKIEQKCPD